MLTEAELLARAKELRRNPTEWEIRVWRHLSNSQTGWKFRRQHVIFPYICDFFCPAKGLILEIDGDTHDSMADTQRDAVLLSNGFATVRYSNRDVRDHLEGVIGGVIDALNRRPDRWPDRPHPNPSPEGEGLKL